MRSRIRTGAFSAVCLLAAMLSLRGCGGDDARTSQELAREPASVSKALTSADVCVDGDPACTPTGAHGKHGSFDCKVCHAVGGRLSFKLGGPAYRPSGPPPTFDAVAKTCSNVACHGVPEGTYSYYFPGGNGEPELKTVPYGGNTMTTPSWYATGASCAACHGNPPFGPYFYPWHSGQHANQDSSGPYNQCPLCHSDATGQNGQGTAITNPAMHANSVVDVTATFRTQCFGCH